MLVSYPVDIIWHMPVVYPGKIILHISVGYPVYNSQLFWREPEML